MFRAEYDKFPEILLPRPVELALHLLVVNPKNVERDDINSARLHFEDFVLPFTRGVARIMEFAHHRKKRLSIEREVAIVDRQFVARRRFSPGGEV